MTTRSGLAILAVLALAGLGLAIPYMSDNGIAGYRRDPLRYRVAMNALQDFWSVNRGTGSSIVTPRARVTRVWTDAGHCHDPRATTEIADYRAEVNGISWFGIPGPTLDVSCGGLQWRRR